MELRVTSVNQSIWTVLVLNVDSIFMRAIFNSTLVYNVKYFVFSDIFETYG